MTFRMQWMLMPPAIIVAAPCCATVYLTVEQAQAQLMPGHTMTPVAVTLSTAQVAQIEKASGVRVREREVRAWRADSDAMFFIDRVIGKHDFITYALAINAAGAVTGLEILEYRETYGGQVRNPAWRAQFSGKRHGAALKLDADIRNLSGATLSCRHVTDGVKRLLATHAVIAAKR